MAYIPPSNRLCWASRCATPPASVKCPVCPVLTAAQVAVMISAPAPATTTNEPSTVSVRA